MIRVIALLASLLCVLPAVAQPELSSVSPQLIERIMELPPRQREALARQYGIDLGLGVIGAERSGGVGDDGEPLSQRQMLDESGVDFEDQLVTKSTTQDDSSVPRFGRDIFSASNARFSVTDDSSVPDSYQLGPGDEFVINLFGKQNEQLILPVNREGMIMFPKLGAIAVGGLTLNQARALIESRVSQQFIGVESVVTIGRTRAISVFLAGEVAMPGTYSVSAFTSLTQALYQAGGVSDIGSLRDIRVLRNGKVAARFDVYKLLLEGDAAGDLQLKSGDVVFVPAYQGVAAVQGEVKRPMLFELKAGETLGDLIRMAGSYTSKAFPSLAVLTRTPADGGVAAAISLNLMDLPTLNIPVLDGDVVRVPTKGAELSNVVALKGAVQRPGDYGWFDGMRVSHLLRDARTDLLREADLSFAMIVRIENRVLDISVLQFSLVDAIQNPGTDLDPKLQEYDELIVFSLPELEGVELEGDQVGREFSRAILLKPVIDKLRAQAREDEPVQVVSVSGAVRAPGVYPLFRNMSVAGLIEASGGLKDSAYLNAAELRVLREKRGGEIEARYTEIDLRDVLTGTNDPQLGSRDHVTIRDIPDWSPVDKVVLEGEVAFPGEYLIQPGETLSDIIRRAGGLTPEAFPEGAIFTRVEVAEREAQRAREFAANIRQTYASRLLTEESTSGTLDDISQITETLEEFEGRGRMLIDLPRALANIAESDVEVSDGDTLFIPKKTNTVTVVGEVFQQGTHTFSDANSLKDYLSLSAGLTTRADSKAIYVVKANGSVVAFDNSWWKFGGVAQNIAPGDTIVVPVNSRYKESLSRWREITQIVYQSIISVAAVANL